MSFNQNKGPYTNEYIRSEKIVLLDEDWQQIWIFSKKDALQKAELETKDLIQIWFNPKEKAVIAKLMDIWKYLYQKKKEENEKRKTQKTKTLKEVKFSYNIWDNELNFKIEKAKEFLKSWHSVKFFWQLRWRENIYANKLYKRLKLIESDLENIWKSQWIKKEKKWYSMVLFAKTK